MQFLLECKGNGKISRNGCFSLFLYGSVQICLVQQVLVAWRFASARTCFSASPHGYGAFVAVRGNRRTHVRQLASVRTPIVVRTHASWRAWAFAVLGRGVGAETQCHWVPQGEPNGRCGDGGARWSWGESCFPSPLLKGMLEVQVLPRLGGRVSGRGSFPKVRQRRAVPQGLSARRTEDLLICRSCAADGRGRGSTCRSWPRCRRAPRSPRCTVRTRC